MAIFLSTEKCTLISFQSSFESGSELCALCDRWCLRSPISQKPLEAHLMHNLCCVVEMSVIHGVLLKKKKQNTTIYSN